MDCVFCKIVNKEISSSLVYEDEKILAFKDLEPIAPVHVLIIPKNHVASANYITEENAEIISHIFKCIPKISKMLNLEKGFRIINNCGPEGGQTVNHLHFHLIGGKKLSWPSC